MRSSVSYMLSAGGGECAMSHPDYPQHAHHHACLLVLVRGLGPGVKPRLFNKIWDRLNRITNVKITDSGGQIRDIWVRYIREHPVQNNDWGDFQTHRRLLGLVTVGKYETQAELNEVCRVHESLKVKYVSTLFDSRCIIFGPSKLDNITSLTEDISKLVQDLNEEATLSTSEAPNPKPAIVKSESSSSENSDQSPKSSSAIPENDFTTPSNFKTRALFYSDTDPCIDLEVQITDFINSLFWVLESKRLERSREKIDKVSLLLAPFEKKDFVGLDLESRNNRKRCMGRVTKHLADLTLQAGLINDSITLYQNASDTLKTVNDWLWLGAAYEGLCAASAILLYPNIRYTINFQRNASLQEGSPNKAVKHMLMNNKKTGIQKLTEKEPIHDSSKADEQQSSLQSDAGRVKFGAIGGLMAQNVLGAEDIARRYKEAIIHYSKYQNAGIIETEASFKAARLAVEQNHALQAASFLQNVVIINLSLSEIERIQRFETLSDLYQQIGFMRKAAFCQRLAATRYVSQNNPNPDWQQCYRLMLESFTGHKLSLEPTEVIANNIGWPSLQVQLLQQLVVSARRMGNPALATRHLTFLIQVMWKHLSPVERKEFAMQLQSLSSQCEGAPVPLVLDNGIVIPPANLTDLPFCQSFTLSNLKPHMRPQKIETSKLDSGPFLYTPIHFGSMDRKSNKPKSKMEYLWVQNDVCEVNLKLQNPLPFELEVSNMRLLTNGIVFESLPQTVVLPADNVTAHVKLSGVPIESGELEILGYSTHTLGVKSNCRLKNMMDRNFLNSYSVEVIPQLPTLEISTDVQEQENPAGNCDNVVKTANISLYNGEESECKVTITNTGTVPIDYLDISMHSALVPDVQNKIFKWSEEDLKKQLPLQPQCSASMVLSLYGEADFLGPLVGDITGGINTMAGGGTNSLYSAGSGLTNSGHTSLPSRVHSPTNTLLGKRTELTSSFRSTTSGHSSLATLSLPHNNLTTPHSRNISGHLIVRYSGGSGYKEGYCRQSTLSINLELIPSVQITHWDVLPAETASQFYLVLDVMNLTQQEISLEYTTDKNMLIEAQESCRVPVPVNRCPLEKMPQEEPQSETDSLNPYPSFLQDIDRACSEHITDLVVLKWQLIGTQVHGTASLKGISLASQMLDLVRVAPLQWEVTLNAQQLRPQEEYACQAGQCVKIGVSIANHLPKPLSHLSLSISFYQDHQNGVNDYRLETRVACTGANKILLPLLKEQDKAHHECSVVFFNPGRYKADIQCSAPIHIMSSQSVNQSTSDKRPMSPVMQTPAHIWRFIPPLEITVHD